jgi:hypothetical protein
VTSSCWMPTGRPRSSAAVAASVWVSERMPHGPALFVVGLQTFAQPPYPGSAGTAPGHSYQEIGQFAQRRRLGAATAPTRVSVPTGTRFRPHSKLARCASGATRPANRARVGVHLAECIVYVASSRRRRCRRLPLKGKPDYVGRQYEGGIDGCALAKSGAE